MPDSIVGITPYGTKSDGYVLSRTTSSAWITRKVGQARMGTSRWTRLWLNQTTPNGVTHQPCRLMDVQLGHDPAAVGFRRLDADIE